MKIYALFLNIFLWERYNNRNYPGMVTHNLSLRRFKQDGKIKI